MQSYAFHNNQFVPLDEAQVSVATHALHYGTGCFEGIRGNWNPAENTLYLFKLREHYERLLKSCRIIRIALPYTVDDLCAITLDLVRRSGADQDCYLRPLAYKSANELGPRVHNVEDGLMIYVRPLANYLDPNGIRCAVSSWRRIDDNMIPARAKITGGYINSALARTEANENGFDEAILLNADGHVSEGSGENIFLVRDGALHTPGVSENILEGITRDCVMTLAKREFGIDTVQRAIDRSELYTADEIFLTGTAAHVTPVIEVDRRPVGSGAVGPVTEKLLKLYFDVIRGMHPTYRHWCTPVTPALVETSAR